MESSSIDARGARLALRMYIKWSWVLVVALVGGFFVGSSMSSNTVVVGESQLIIGLTDDVRWPFYDAVLVRQQGLIEEFDLAETTREATGIEPISVAVVSENTQNSTLNVLVKINGSSEDARVFADELGRQLVDANTAAQTTEYVQEVEDLQTQLAEQDALALQYETEIADLTDEWVLIQDELVVADPGDAPELRGLAIESDRNRRVTERRLDGVIAAQSSLTTQLAQAERNVANTSSPVEVSRAATAVEGSSTDLAPVLAILNFLLALLAVPFLERAFGRVSVMDQLGLVFPDAKLIDTRRAPTGAVRPVDVVALSVKSLAADRGVAGSAARGQTSSAVAVAEVAPAAVTEAVVDAISRDGRGHVTQVDLETPEGLHDAVDADQVVLIVPTRSVRVGRAREMANDLALLDAAPEIVVLSKRSKRRQSSESSHEWTPVRAGDENLAEPSPVAAPKEPELFDGRAAESEAERAEPKSEPARRRRLVSAHEVVGNQARRTSSPSAPSNRADVERPRSEAEEAGRTKDRSTGTGRSSAEASRTRPDRQGGSGSQATRSGDESGSSSSAGSKTSSGSSSVKPDRGKGSAEVDSASDGDESAEKSEKVADRKVSASTVKGSDGSSSGPAKRRRLPAKDSSSAKRRSMTSMADAASDDDASAGSKTSSDDDAVNAELANDGSKVDNADSNSGKKTAARSS